MKTSLLCVSNISCGYGARMVIQDISFSLEAGEVLCLLGPNGVGKTTLFKTILGFLQPSQGKIYIEGENIVKWNRNKLAKAVAYVPQSHQPVFPFTVMEIVLMGRTAHLGTLSTPTKKDYDRAREVMEQLDILWLKDKTYTKISGGQQQMVLIARALIQEAKILIMDEPTSSLDYGNQIKVLEKIKSLSSGGFSVIMTSHSPNHAFLCASKVALLKRNSCFVVGEVEDVIIEASLKETYGIDVKIASVNDKSGGRIKGCIPVFS